MNRRKLSLCFLYKFTVKFLEPFMLSHRWGTLFISTLVRDYTADIKQVVQGTNVRLSVKLLKY